MRSKSEIAADACRLAARADPLGFYREHYAGLTRGQLNDQAPGLYKCLSRKGLLGDIPLYRPFGGDAVAYYRQHYLGLTRGQLRDHDPGLYEYLRQKGLLAAIPLRRVVFPDPLAYYQAHCPGMTRKQVSMAEPQFYNYLQRYRLLSTVPFAAPARTSAADRDAWQQELLSEQSPNTQTAATAGPHRRPPTLASAHLECFRVIPE